MPYRRLPDTLSDINSAMPNFAAIVFSAVPEPSNWLAGALSLGVILFAFTRGLRHRQRR